MSKTETLQLRGTLEGHNGWVTSLATCDQDPDLLVSGSRDKSVIVWRLSPSEENYGVAKRSLRGHSHIVEDVAISNDGCYVLSASWDKTLRLWDLSDGTSTRFVGHTGDVLSCDFTSDNLMVVSSSRDKTVRLWNVLGDPVFVIDGPQSHSDWVSAVSVTPTTDERAPLVLSASHDKTIKTWDVTSGRLKADYVGHTGYINALTLSPDGSLCATGGKDGQALIWDVYDGKFRNALPPGDEIYDFAFSPRRYWLAAATASGIKIYNLQEHVVIDELKPEAIEGEGPVPRTLTWSADGNVLFAGYTDNKIRVWQVMHTM